MRKHQGIAMAALFAVGLVFSSPAGAQELKDPRIGVWRNVNNAGNVMNYESIPGGGTRLKVDAVNSAGQVTSYWGYDTFFDGQWQPVTGTDRSPQAEDATATLKNRYTTEIRYRRPAGGALDRILENVVSQDGRRLWVITRNPEGIVTGVTIYERVR